MLRVPTWLLSFFGLLFGFYHSVLGLAWINKNDRPEIVVASLIAYLAVLIPTISVGKTRAMGRVLAVIDVVVCALIPLAIGSQLDPKHLTDYATWYVLGVGTVLGGMAVRGQRMLAWFGLIILVGEIAMWGGVASLASTGLPGVLSLLVTGHAVSIGVERAVRTTRELDQQAEITAAETAATEAASRIRGTLLEKTLRTSIPALNLIAALGGELNESQKREARLLEAGLRDEIRGEELLNDAMRRAIKLARERGIEVLVLDEGGLSGLGSEEREILLDRAAASFVNVSSGRLTVRAPQGENWRVTVAAVRPGHSEPDLWLKLS
ncbi:MAG: hypothetical protein ACKOUD_05985 [Rhodoluna sp.]